MEKNEIAIQGAQTVQRAVGLLKLIATNTKEGARLTDIAHEMELETPTVHRLLKALVAEGLLAKNEDTRRYSLGSLIYELGLAATNDFDLSILSSSVLKALALKTSDTAFLFIRSGDDAVCITREQGEYHIQTPVVPVGSRQPLGVSTGGLTILSALSPEEMEKVLQTTAMRLNIYGGLTIDSARQLYNHSHDKGYAVIANHTAPSVKGVGVPVFDKTHKPIGAVTVATTASRMTEEHVQNVLPHLRKAASEISELFELNTK